GSAGTVRLQRIVVTTDNGRYNGDGGGIWFAGASNASVLELVDSEVVSNTALFDGGGVYVWGGKLLVGLLSLVGAHAAASDGGGIAAQNGALVDVAGGWVMGNTALFDGGGIWAPDAQVKVRTSSVAPAVSQNIAGQDGGGLSLGGQYDDTISALPGELPARISDNQASRGAGLFINGSQVLVDY